MLDEKVKALFKKHLDIDPSEIKPDQPLDKSLGIDSTELVEVSVAIKKELGVPLKDNEIKKTQTFNEIIALLKSKSGDSGCGPTCGCRH